MSDSSTRIWGRPHSRCVWRFLDLAPELTMTEHGSICLWGATWIQPGSNYACEGGPWILPGSSYIRIVRGGALGSWMDPPINLCEGGTLGSRMDPTIYV